MRPLAVAVLLILPGCVQLDDPDGADPTTPADRAPFWHDVRVAPDGFAGSEVSLAVDPDDPLHVVAVAHASGFGVYESFDGGQNWSAERLTAQGLFGVGPAPAGTHLSLSDPVAAFSPDSRLHVAGLAYLPSSAVFVATRTDAGWEASTVWQSEVAATFNDKEWLGIDPRTGAMVVAWQREPALDQLRGVEQQTDGAVDADVGQIVFSRSTDGASWSVPEQVGHGLHSNGTQVVFTPEGTGYMAWVDYEDPHLDVVVSRDAGQTWGGLTVPSDISIVGSYAGFPRMHTLPGMAASPVGDDVYLVWHDDRHGDADIMLAHSPDGASTWQRHRVPDGPEGDGDVQFYPWVAVGGDGTAHITYYGAADGTSDFAYRHVAFDPDTGFGAVRDISNTTFVVFDEGDGPADLGDYTAAAARGDAAYAAWADPRGDASYVHVGHLTR